MFVTFDRELQGQIRKHFDWRFRTLYRKGTSMSHIFGRATLSWTGSALLFAEAVNQYRHYALLVQVCQCHFDRSPVWHFPPPPHTRLHWGYGRRSYKDR